MRKAIVCALAIFGALMVIGAVLCVILGVINCITYGKGLWLLLIAAPAVLWMPIKGIFGVCDKINEAEEMNE